MHRSALLCIVFLLTTYSNDCLAQSKASNSVTERPNIVFILTDEHRWDSYGAPGLQRIKTPYLDSIANQGTRFENAFVTLAICSPSRAACLTGRYGSANGVTSFGKVSLNDGEKTFAHALREAGYSTGVTGKWHLKTTPEECGFDFASTCWSNGTWYNRRFKLDGENQARQVPGFVDDVAADESLRFIRQATDTGKPFVLWMCTQVPHMDGQHTWPADEKYLARHPASKMPVPKSWNDDLEGKPDYLRAARNRTRALEYGYDSPTNIRNHIRDYRASVEQMDAAVGRVLSEIQKGTLKENTWVILMGDNGWFLGEHGMTSKVLPYEESMRVPMAIAGPNTPAQAVNHIALNIDLTATIYELAGLSLPAQMHGRSLLPIVWGETPHDWRKSFLYEAPTPQLGSQPLWAIRTDRWKYIETRSANGATYQELYDLSEDQSELHNLVPNSENRPIVEQLQDELKQELANIEAKSEVMQGTFTANAKIATGVLAARQRTESENPIPANPPSVPKTDIFISGVYPHLTTYGVYSQNGAHYKNGHNECGIGAIVPWAGKLWMVNYAPHMPKGSEHKLYSVDPDMRNQITVHEESVGGTPAGRMIHSESNQLLIGHHLIQSDGKIRTIPPAVMPMRVTAIARHLRDPANMVYYIDMEGSIWEANVHTLEVKRLFKKPVPGWHGKGGYTSQGRLVVSNNGELHVGNYSDVLVGGEAKNAEERGVLAEWDGNQWRIVERRQYTEVTGPNGILGGDDENAPLWSMGWDRRSVRFKLLEDGKWHTYLFPKASYCNDASHGWYTEWPRIREITDGRWMMDMHGMFFNFPPTFSSKNTQGIEPIGSHLRYVPDFCEWNGKLVLATDETSIQGNPLAGQPQSNLWFGDYKDLMNWGPASGYGGPWVDDEVQKDKWSDPFLISGFEQRTLHLAAGRIKPLSQNLLRATDQQTITAIPDELAVLPKVTVNRGDWHKPAPGYSFVVDQPVTVFLAVDRRGDPKLDSKWVQSNIEVRWGKGFRDRVFQREFPAGVVEIPGNNTEHTSRSFGMPHTAFVRSAGDALVIDPQGAAVVRTPQVEDTNHNGQSVLFSVQIDAAGNGEWTDFGSFKVRQNQASSTVLPADLNAVWMRFKVDQACVATAFLHQTSPYPNSDRNAAHEDLFNGIADVQDSAVMSGLVYPAKRNRNLRLLASNGSSFEFSKANFSFTADQPDERLAKLLEVEPEFHVDDASVVVESQGKRFRLPKGDSLYDKPFDSGWPRAVREVESERHLANIHGTFYELPLVTNGAPPAWHLIRPVSSHRKQISDFCSWNGLLVLSGVKSDAAPDGHVYRAPKLEAGLWFGGVDDLWKFGKPTGNGGPWKETSVEARVPSDPYLMRGYDEKIATLSHGAGKQVRITLQIDIDGNGRWVDYKQFSIPPGESVNHAFPHGFSACWIRAVSDTATTATLHLEYR